MEIGDPERTFTVEPVEDPVPRELPAEPAEQVIEANGTYRTELLPGFELSLARLLALSDVWKRPH